MTTSLTTARDALTRIDEGVGRPGDDELAELYERFCQQKAVVLQARIAEAEYSVWLAEQCVVCGPDGSTGPECGACVIEHDHDMTRREDV